jgi:hypothetical protein
LCAKFVFCRKEILPKTSGNSALTSFFQTSKNLKLEGGFGDLQEALLIVLLGILTTIVIAYLDKLDNDSIGLIQILVIDLFAAILFFKVSKYQKLICKLHFVLILLINILLLFNTTGWNEGRMGGSAYTIQMLQPATDLMYGLILFSAFLLGIPIGLYIIFLVGLSQLFCNSLETTKEKD